MNRGGLPMFIQESKLVNTKEMLRKAVMEGYAVPAFNIHNLETVQVIVAAAAEMKSPVILAATPGTFSYAGRDYIQAIAETAAYRYSIPIALHLDHHEKEDDIVASLNLGVKSVMIDGSIHSIEENIHLTKRIVELSKEFGATVEAELGRLGGQEDDLVVNEKDSYLTDPDAAVYFVKETGVDSLAVAIGTAHGLYKATPKLDFDRLALIHSKLDIPLVLHGASGISTEDVRRAISLGCAKVNIATELKIPFSGALRDYLINHTVESDPRRYMAPAKEAMRKVVIEKIKMCMSDGKA